MEVSGWLHTPAALPPGEEFPVRVGWESGWAPEPVWTRGGGTHHCPRREFNPGRSALSLVTLLTEIPLLTLIRLLIISLYFMWVHI